MPRLNRLLTPAKRNSTASSHQITWGIGPGCLITPTNRSIIHLETASAATGINALVTRSAMPALTTDGAASHTKRRIGGTWRNASIRCRHRELSRKSSKDPGSFFAGAVTVGALEGT